MQVLVTGGTGFLGKRVVAEAVRQHHAVTVLARSVDGAEVARNLGASVRIAALDDPKPLALVLADIRPDALLNLVNLRLGHAPAVIEAASAAHVRRAVFVSTTSITTTLPAPSKPMRVAAEQAIRRSGLEWTIVRPTMIYGARDDRNLARLLVALRRSPVLPIPGRGDRLQQPVHVRDLATAIVNAIGRPVAVGKTYDVAGPTPITFTDLLRESARVVGRRTIFIPLPLVPTIAIARLYERVATDPRIRAEQIERLAEDKSFRIDDAVKDLGFAPRTFRDGIATEAQELFSPSSTSAN